MGDDVELRQYIETCIKREIDELVDLGSHDELWRLWDYLWGRMPVRPTSR
jgi:hypothetical protein